MIFYATIGAIAVGIVLALLLLQFLEGNRISIQIDIDNRDKEDDDPEL